MHSGHRERLRHKLFSESDLPPHELLELLLTFAIPRRNTNDIAHRLLERFGTLTAVFEADTEDLMTVAGVGENAAALLKLMPRLGVSIAGKAKRPTIHLDTVTKLAAYGKRLFRNTEREALYALLLDSRLQLVDCVRLTVGSSAGAKVSIRSLVQCSSLCRCAGVVLIHNHPQGFGAGSMEDKRFTARVEELFAMLDLAVIEHMILAGDRYVTLIGRYEADDRLLLNI